MPEAYWDIECADLVDAADLEALGVVAVPVDAVTTARWAAIPAAHIIRTVGGVSCAWSDGGDIGGTTGSWVQVEAIPNAADEWSHPWHVPGEATCTEYSCTAEQLSDGDAWITVTTGAVGLDAAEFAVIVDEVAVRLSQARGDEVTVAPQELAESCADVADIAAIGAALGTETPLAFSSGAGGWSIVSAAQSLAGLPGIPSCGISAAADPMAAYGTITWLQAGEWAFEEAGTEGRESIELPGAQGDEAHLECNAVEAGCSVSFLLDGAWVIVSAIELALPYPDPSVQPAKAEVRDAAVAIAALVTAG